MWDQRQWLQRYLDSGDYGLAWQVLERIQRNLVDEDWAYYDIGPHWEFHKFRNRLLDVVQTLQPHTDANADQVYRFVSGLLVEGAEAIPHIMDLEDDRFCRIVGYTWWFSQHWTGLGELGQLMDLVWVWRSSWPGFVIDIFNHNSDQSIDSIQMRRQGDPEWGDSRLGRHGYWLERRGTLPPTEVFRYVEEQVRKRWGTSLQPYGECIPSGTGRSFFWALTEGDGHYEFRVTLEGTSQTIETSAFISSDHLEPYVWMPGTGSVEVGPVAHGARSTPAMGDVLTWVPDLGSIPLRWIYHSAVPGPGGGPEHQGVCGAMGEGSDA